MGLLNGGVIIAKQGRFAMKKKNYSQFVSPNPACFFFPEEYCRGKHHRILFPNIDCEIADLSIFIRFIIRLCIQYIPKECSNNNLANLLVFSTINCVALPVTQQIIRPIKRLESR